MTPELAVVLLVATVAAMVSTLVLLVTLDHQIEEGFASIYPEGEDLERDGLAWEWRLSLASLPEAYWY
jgi:hypothetical protein